MVEVDIAFCNESCWLVTGDMIFTIGVNGFACGGV